MKIVDYCEDCLPSTNTLQLILKQTVLNLEFLREEYRNRIFSKVALKQLADLEKRAPSKVHLCDEGLSQGIINLSGLIVELTNMDETKSAKEGQLRAEEIRLLRVETEQLKQQNTELKMKTQVQVEGLQEQLRVRNEKHYQLLEKLQVQEEAKRQAEDQVAGMEEQMRGLHARNVDLEEQIKVQNRSTSNIDEANKELQLENQGLLENNKALQVEIDKSKRERNRMGVEARDSGDELREMAVKIAQLLERLKLADLGKSRAMEALQKKELDMAALQKKNARLIKETADEAQAKVQAQLDVKSLQEQVRALKLNNTAIAKKSKEEASLKVKSMEECEQLKEQKKSADARISILDVGAVLAIVAVVLISAVLIVMFIVTTFLPPTLREENAF